MDVLDGILARFDNLQVSYPPPEIIEAHRPGTTFRRLSL